MALSRGVAETARLIASLELKDNLSRGIGTALGSVGRMEAGLGRMGRGAGQVASGLDRLGTRAAIAAAGGIAAVVQASASFEQAFTGIEKTVDETANTTFPELEEAIRSMARSIPVSFEELAGIGEAGGALGIAADDLEDFIDVVARLSVSTNLSSDQAATALGQLGNVLHLSGDDFRDFADSLVALGNAGASTEDQIVETAARFGAAGNAAGLSKEEILALSSAVASMGIQVEAGGSALSRIFSSVATNIGTSSDKAVAFADTLGLSAREFRQAWEKDALGTFQDFLTELNKLDQFEQASVLKGIGITNTRDVNTVRLMAQNVGFVAEQLDIAANAQGALNEESQKFFDTASGQFKVLVNNARDAGVTIGNELLPIFKELTQELTTFLNKPETRQALQEFGRDLADGIRNVVAEIRKADFSGLIDGMRTAAQIAKTAFEIFHSLPPQVQALAVSAIALNKVSGGAVGSIAKGLGNIFAGALQTLAPKGLGQAVGGLVGGRGSTPANPLFVSVVGPGGLGAGGVGAAAAGGRGFWAGVGKVFGIAAVGVIGAEIGRTIGGALVESTIRPAIEFEQDRFQQFLNNPAATADIDVIKHNLAAVEAGIHDVAGNTVDGLERWLIPGLSELEGQRDQLRELLTAAETAERNRARDAGDLFHAQQAQAGTQADAAAKTAAALRNLPLELRLQQDKAFKESITSPAEFLRILRRTSEFGAKGEGTAIERGPTTGRDPVGKAFVSLVRRLDERTLRSNEVQGEIRRHIQAARLLIGTGNRQQDRQLRDTIATLRRIVRTGEVSNRTESRSERRLAELRATAQRTHNVLQGVERDTSNTASSTAALARKDFSPDVNVTVPVSTYVSISDIVRQASTYNVATSYASQTRRGFTP